MSKFKKVLNKVRKARLYRGRELKVKLIRKLSRRKMATSLMKKKKSKRGRKMSHQTFSLKYRVKNLIPNFHRSGKTVLLERQSKEM